MVMVCLSKGEQADQIAGVLGVCRLQAERAAEDGILKPSIVSLGVLFPEHGVLFSAGLGPGKACHSLFI